MELEQNRMLTKEVPVDIKEVCHYCTANVYIPLCHYASLSASSDLYCGQRPAV